MKIVCQTLFLLAFLFVSVANAQNKYEWKEATSAGYKYKYVTNDPTKTRFYTLKNGLTAISLRTIRLPVLEYELQYAQEATPTLPLTPDLPIISNICFLRGLINSAHLTGKKKNLISIKSKAYTKYITKRQTL